jgi:hypothetical protein
VELPYGTPGAENVHAVWRMRVARRAVGVYAGNRNLAALAVAGSVGAGTAGQFSDLELDCYWVRPAGRRGPARSRPRAGRPVGFMPLACFGPDDRLNSLPQACSGRADSDLLHEDRDLADRLGGTPGRARETSPDLDRLPVGDRMAGSAFHFCQVLGAVQDHRYERLIVRGHH